MHTITNRGDKTEGWQGVTNVADKDNNIFVIEGDTIQLVAAEDVDADNAYIGFKYITANDAKNNKFTITSAADVLEGQSIVMTKDSTLKVAAPEDEVLYTLVPSTESKYGVEDALKKVTYTIMDADSAFIIYDAKRGYVFSNGKYATKNGTPAEFSMIAVDTDSTFVLYDATATPVKVWTLVTICSSLNRSQLLPLTNLCRSTYASRLSMATMLLLTLRTRVSQFAKVT